MKVVRDASWNEVCFYWLRSERAYHPNLEPDLVESFDEDDAASAGARARELMCRRFPIVCPISPDVDCLEVFVGERDLPSLYDTCYDWFEDTGGTFRLTDTLTHLPAGRTWNHNGRVESIEHFAKVQARIDFLKAAPFCRGRIPDPRCEPARWAVHDHRLAGALDLSAALNRPPHSVCVLSHICTRHLPLGIRSR